MHEFTKKLLKELDARAEMYMVALANIFLRELAASFI
jgi:hypothetical protein